LNSDSFPQPGAEALALSLDLQARILAAIDGNGGWLGFAKFMQLALYAPGLGYYSAGAAKLGPSGDFTTAPEQGDWLAAALARFLAAQFDSLGEARILELGAGSGRLAESLLAALSERGYAAVEYSILETSADFRARQIARLGAGRQVIWLDELPVTPFRGTTRRVG
jgi:SAM-dependent MidA family methyltransferase